MYVTQFRACFRPEEGGHSSVLIWQIHSLCQMRRLTALLSDNQYLLTSQKVESARDTLQGWLELGWNN